MFSGTVNIIKRGKLLHCGAKVRLGSVRRGNSVKLVSICNTTWRLEDETYEADAKEVTCKKCLKILSKADESGKVNLGRAKQ